MTVASSIVQLLRLVASQVANAVRSLFQGNPRGALDALRAAAQFLHDDFVTVLVRLQQVLRLWPVPDSTIDRILIVKLDRIGDMVNTTPVFDALRTAFPAARLDIVAHPGPLALLEADDRITNRFPHRSWLYHDLPMLPPGIPTLALVGRLTRTSYPLVVYLRGSLPFLLLALTSRFAAAKFVAGEPVIRRYLKAIDGLTAPRAATAPRLTIPEQAALRARSLVARDDTDCPVIAIHPTSQTVTKDWPLDRYAQLADELSDRFHARVHFFGGPADRDKIDRLIALSRFTHHYHCSLPLLDVAASIAASDLFIGNDSGLAHIAAAVGTPLVLVWGSVNLEMARPATQPGQGAILFRNLACRERCPESRCINPVHLECLNNISLQEVVAAAEQFLNQRRNESVS